LKLDQVKAGSGGDCLEQAPKGAQEKIPPGGR